MKKIIAIIIAITIAFIPVMGAEAVSKPAKVKSVKVTKKTQTSVTLKWKKAKRAKKYQVFVKSSKKYKKVKTLKKTKVTIKKLKAGKTYRFKVRGVRGKKVGKFSKVIKVKVKAKGGVDYKTVHKVSSPTQIAKKGTYQFTNPLTGRTDTVKVEDVENTSLKRSITGTKNGVFYHIAIRNGEVISYQYNKSGNTTDYRCGGVINSNGAPGYGTEAKTKNTIIKWTCDGTDPAKVTEDKWGHCEYTKEWVESVPYGNPKPRDQKKWDEKYKHEDGYWKYLDTYLQGTTTYGKYRCICDNSETASYRRVFWVKVYKNGKMIFEEYRVHYEVGF